MSDPNAPQNRQYPNRSPQGPQQPHPGATAFAPSGPPPKKKRRVWLWVLLGVLVLVFLLIAACSAIFAKSVGEAVQSAAPQQPSTVPSSGASGGATSAPTSNTATFGDTVKYDDGLAVTITKTKNAKQSKYTEHPGEPVTVFYVRVTNNTDQNLNGDLVSVDSTYGKDGSNADQVYDVDSFGDQISGTIAKGKSKTGEYAFAVPTKERGDVDVEVSLVDFDHDSALFSGSVK